MLRKELKPERKQVSKIVLADKRSIVLTRKAPSQVGAFLVIAITEPIVIASLLLMQ